MHQFLDELRSSSAASYNPDLKRDDLDVSKKTLKSTPALRRSEYQAFYIVWSWLDRASKNISKRRRLR